MGLRERLRVLFRGQADDAAEMYRKHLEERIDKVDRKLDQQARIKRIDTQAEVQQAGNR